jgi:hypothetical protein
MRTGLALVLALASTGVLSWAEEDSKIVFRSDPSKTEAEAETERPKEPAQEREPPAPLAEVEGTFTACTAARMLELELARRISNIDPSRATGKRWTQYSTLQALRGRWEDLIAQDQD